MWVLKFQGACGSKHVFLLRCGRWFHVCLPRVGRLLASCGWCTLAARGSLVIGACFAVSYNTFPSPAQSECTMQYSVLVALLLFHGEAVGLDHLSTGQYCFGSHSDQGKCPKITYKYLSLVAKLSQLKALFWVIEYQQQPTICCVLSYPLKGY